MRNQRPNVKKSYQLECIETVYDSNRKAVDLQVVFVRQNGYRIRIVPTNTQVSWDYHKKCETMSDKKCIRGEQNSGDEMLSIMCCFCNESWVHI